MGSALGPLLANLFMCSIEDTLKLESKMPTYYKRYVDDTLTIMPDITSAVNFLEILNQYHSGLSFKFTMETNSNSLPFWARSCSTNTHMLRLRCTLNPQILAFCCITRAI